MARILEFLVEFCAGILDLGILVLGILEFPTMSSSSPFRVSRCVILGLDPRINFRIPRLFGG